MFSALSQDLVRLNNRQKYLFIFLTSKNRLFLSKIRLIFVQFTLLLHR